MKEKQSGVYVLCNTVTGHRYVGSTLDLDRRKRQHFAELQRQVHRNSSLQIAYNQQGKSAFIFTVLEFCDELSLLNREQYWLDTLQPEYNVNKKSGNSIEDYINTEEAKRKRIEAYKANHAAGKHKKRDYTPPTGPDHPNFGKHWPEEMRKRISASLSGEKNPGYGKRRSPESVQKGAEKRAQYYDGLVSPDGTVYAPIVNMSKFCREHDLHVSHAVAVMHNKLPHHKGWTRYIPPNPR